MLLIFVIFLIKCNILYILVSKEGGLSRIRPPPFVRHCSEYTSLRRRDRMILELCIFGNCSVGRHELKLDMDRAMQAYLKQFNSMYYRFNSLGVFRHLLAWSCLCLYSRMFKTNSPYISRFKYCFRYNSLLSTNVRELFGSYFNVSDVFDNDLVAIKSRIDFIERNEPRSSYTFSVID